MNAVSKTRKKRSGSGAARRRAKPTAAARREQQRKTRAAFSLALSLFSLPMAIAGLLFPLPAGLAAVLVALIALIAGRGQKWPGRIALVAILLGVCGLIGGFVVGITVTARA